MKPENETTELELIAKAFQAISKEISYEGLAKALLRKPSAIAGPLEAVFC